MHLTDVSNYNYFLVFACSMVENSITTAKFNCRCKSHVNMSVMVGIHHISILFSHRRGIGTT